jgi:hypothetical protein
MRGGWIDKGDPDLAAGPGLATQQLEQSRVQPSRQTVASFLVGEWLPAVRMAGLRDSTWVSYRLNVEKHVVPGLGAC